MSAFAPDWAPWTKGGWRRRFGAPAGDPGFEHVTVAAIIVRAHALVGGLMAGWVVIADMASGSDPFRA